MAKDLSSGQFSQYFSQNTKHIRMPVLLSISFCPKYSSYLTSSFRISLNLCFVSVVISSCFYTTCLLSLFSLFSLTTGNKIPQSLMSSLLHPWMKAETGETIASHFSACSLFSSFASRRRRLLFSSSSYHCLLILLSHSHPAQVLFPRVTQEVTSLTREGMKESQSLILEKSAEKTQEKKEDAE